MLIYDDKSKNLIERVGNDTPLIFRESYTNVEFMATNHEVTVANEQLNRALACKFYVTLEEFLSNFDIPISILSAIPKTDLECGFSVNCSINYDTEWVDFYIDCYEENGDSKLEISYWQTPCYGCDKCEGDGAECDRYLSGDALF